MGIEGLLGLLKPIIVKAHIEDFRGKRAAVHVSSWLYKGLHSCSWEIGIGKNTYRYLNYPLKMVNLLLKHGIKPLIVFDGCVPPLKQNVVINRRLEKAKNREIGKKLLEEGRIEKAVSMFSRSVSLEPHIVQIFTDVLYSMEVEYIISPFEADAQIAYLCKEGIVDVAITEDSDLIVYGCENIIFKLAIDGTCENIVLSETLCNAEYIKNTSNSTIKSLGMLPKNKFMELCIASGCDYMEKIPGFGIKTALKLLKESSLSAALNQVKYKRQFIGKVPENYEQCVERIKLQFLHGKVIDPRTYKMAEVSPPPDSVLKEDLDALGQALDPALVKPFAQGLYCFDENWYRERMTKKEVEEIVKEMMAESAKSYFFSKKSADAAEKIKRKGKIGNILKKGSHISEAGSQEQNDIKDLRQEEINMLVDLLRKEREESKEEVKEIGSVQTKANPFMKRIVVINNKVNKIINNSMSKKRMPFAVYNDNSLAEFFPKTSKRFRVDVN